MGGRRIRRRGRPLPRLAGDAPARGAGARRGIVGWTLAESPAPGGSMRQAFFRAGEPILEVVLAPEASSVARDPAGPARLWGLAFTVKDLDATARALGDIVGEPREAVQPGRRIATLRSGAGIGTAVAFMSPGPGALG